MTELWHCTDCGDEIDFDARREHMKDEHGVTHTIPASKEWQCSACWKMVGESDLSDHQYAHLRARHEHLVRECPDCRPNEPCERAKALEGK